MTNISLIFDYMTCSSLCESDNINHYDISGAWYIANLASANTDSPLALNSCRNHCQTETAIFVLHVNIKVFIFFYL